MTLIEESGPAAESAPAPAATVVPPDEQEIRTASFYVRRTLGGLAAIGVLYLLVTETKARSTLLTVMLAVGSSAAIWVGANLLFNQVRDKWQRFTMLLYFCVTLAVTTIISGNRAIGNDVDDDPVAKMVNKFVNGIRPGTLTTESLIPRVAALVWLPLALSIAAAIVGLVLTRTDARPARLVIGACGLGMIGVVAGLFWNFNARPEFDPVGLVAWTGLGSGIGIGIALLRRIEPVRSLLLGAALGWVVGAFGAPDIGGGPAGWTVVAVAVPPLLIGIRAGLQPNLALRERAAVDVNSRKWIFLAPAIVFSTGMLVVPTITTVVLSFKNREGADFVGADNYRNVFQDETSWNPPADWTSIFRFKGPDFANGFRGGVYDIISLNFFDSSFTGSALFRVGLAVLAVFVVTALMQRSRTGKVVELGSPSMGPLLVGGLLVLLAFVTTFRGTIVNNLWWVVVVTLFSTALGLAIAVLADGVRFEQVAKSIIFMPMAISLVGASVIWRFMYVARDSSKEQTGVLNSLWVAIGRLSTAREVASVAIVILGGLLGIALLNKIARQRPAAIGIVGGAGLVIAGAVIATSIIWLRADTTNISTKHFVVSLVLIALAVLAATALFALAVMKDAIGMVAGAIYVVLVIAALTGFAWLWGGKLTGFQQKIIIGIAAITLLMALLAVVAQRLTTRNFGGVVAPAVFAGLVGWFLLRYFAAFGGGGVGGQATNTVGNIKDSPINFVQESPWNSMFLMVVLIWIQTGFAMVILSAAIKAVPTELLEAARVDGATDSQVFWRVTLPQIAPTIGVVVTTIIVLVMKVFDIVNVMTNGNFETQVLANDMFRQAFQNQNQGQGAALAILIFVSVLPIMVFNIRKMQQEN